MPDLNEQISEYRATQDSKYKQKLQEEKSQEMSEKLNGLNELHAKAIVLDRNLTQHLGSLASLSDLKNNNECVAIIEGLQQALHDLHQGYEIHGLESQEKAAVLNKLNECSAALKTVLESGFIDDVIPTWENIVSQLPFYAPWNLKTRIEKEQQAIKNWLENPKDAPKVADNAANLTETPPLPPTTSELIFAEILDSDDFKALYQSSHDYNARVKNYLSSPAGIEKILSFIEPLISTEGKEPAVFRANHDKIKQLGDWLNNNGILAAWKEQDSAASQLAYALLTNDINTIGWDKVVPILAQQKDQPTWPAIWQSVMEALFNLELSRGNDSAEDSFFKKAGTNLPVFKSNSNFINLKRLIMEGSFFKEFSREEVIEAGLRRHDYDEFSDVKLKSDLKLRHADLRNAVFQDSLLLDPHMEYADLRNALFQNSILVAPYMEHADLSNANLENIAMYNHGTATCEFSDANFQGAKLKNIDFKGADLYRTNFCNTDMQNVLFDFSHLGNGLRGADLSGSSLSNVRFINTGILDISLVGVDLSSIYYEFETSNEKWWLEQIEAKKAACQQRIEQASTLPELEKIEQELEQYDLAKKATIVEYTSDFQWKYVAKVSEADWNDVYKSLYLKTQEVTQSESMISPSIAKLAQEHRQQFDKNNPNPSTDFFQTPKTSKIKQEFRYTYKKLFSLVVFSKWGAESKNGEDLINVRYHDRDYPISFYGKKILDLIRLTCEDTSEKHNPNQILQNIYQLALSGYEACAANKHSNQRIYLHIRMYLDAVYPDVAVQVQERLENESRKQCSIQ